MLTADNHKMRDFFFKCVTEQVFYQTFLCLQLSWVFFVPDLFFESVKMKLFHKNNTQVKMISFEIREFCCFDYCQTWKNTRFDTFFQSFLYLYVLYFGIYTLMTAILKSLQNVIKF